MTITMDTQTWAEEQFGQCDLDDKRRTRRLVHLANQVLCHPSGSLPEQTAEMADLKAAYRLFSCEDVTFEAIAGPPWEQTRRRPPGTYLVLGDTTELDFGVQREIAGMAQTGNGGGWGFLLHSALVVTAEGEEVIGLAGQKIRYRKRLAPAPIAMWVVHAAEVDAPKGVEPIEWVLLTSLPVESFEDAWVVLGYYEKRWLIEEWHKALKTGCRVEHRQLKTKERLERITGLLRVVSVRLLQLKSAARTTPNRPASEVVPKRWIAMLQAARRKTRRKTTPTTSMMIGEFYRELAKLGGFLGRKCDGEPGWITIWRGWQKLDLLVRGAELAETIE